MAPKSKGFNGIDNMSEFLSGEVYGFDGGKLVKGRKRHLVVDTQGLLLGVVVTEANTQDRLGAAAVLMEDSCASDKLQLIWVDSGYSGGQFFRYKADSPYLNSLCDARDVGVVEGCPLYTGIIPGERFARAVVEICGAAVEVVKRTAKEFQVLPRRWVVERTLGWLGRYRRLSKDYEQQRR